MAPVAGAAALQRGRHPALCARLQQGERVELPRSAVEVAGEKPARVVREQRIDADRLPPAQMLLDRLVAQGQIGLRALTAPAADDRGHVAALARADVLPTQRVHVVATAEEAPDERNLLVRRSWWVRARRWRLRGASSEDRLRLLAEREECSQLLVLCAKPLDLAQSSIEPVLRVTSGHVCAGRLYRAGPPVPGRVVRPRSYGSDDGEIGS